MNFLSFVLTFTLLGCFGLSVGGRLINTVSRKKRIVNGDGAQFGQFPYAVFLRFIPTGQICTGSLISDQAVLTAARCVFDHYFAQPYETKHFYGTVGSIINDDTKNRVEFKEFRVHKNYKLEKLEDDIAILIPKERVKTNNYIRSIALPEKGMRFDGEVVTAVGWGKYDFEEEPDTSFLHYMEAKVSECDNVCSSLSSRFNPNKHVCVAQEEDVCMFLGDFGGPLVKIASKADVNIGVLSYGLSMTSCSSLPVVYVSTSVYHDWIKDNAVGNLTYVNSL